MKPLIIGQAPARGNDDKLPFAGRSGARLAKLAGVGDSGDALPKYFDLRNLISKYPGKSVRGGGKGDLFDLGAARLQAGLMYDEFDGMKPRTILFMGKSVAKAFSIDRPYLRSWEWNQHTMVVFPHPSAVNRWWNSQENEADARHFLERLVTYGFI